MLVEKEPIGRAPGADEKGNLMRGEPLRRRHCVVRARARDLTDAAIPPAEDTTQPTRTRMLDTPLQACSTHPLRLGQSLEIPN